MKVKTDTDDRALEIAASLWVLMIKEMDATLNPNPEWWKAEIEEFRKTGHFELAIAYEDGKAVGFADGLIAQMPATGEISGFCRDIYVAPHLRDGRTAELLIKTMEAAARRHGVETVYIYCDPMRQKAWERRGFRAERLMMRRG